MAFRHSFSVGFIARREQGQAERISWRQVGSLKTVKTAEGKTAKTAKKKGKA